MSVPCAGTYDYVSFNGSDEIARQRKNAGIGANLDVHAMGGMFRINSFQPSFQVLMAFYSPSIPRYGWKMELWASDHPTQPNKLAYSIFNTSTVTRIFSNSSPVLGEWFSWQNSKQGGSTGNMTMYINSIAQDDVKEHVGSLNIVTTHAMMFGGYYPAGSPSSWCNCDITKAFLQNGTFTAADSLELHNGGLNGDPGQLIANTTLVYPLPSGTDTANLLRESKLLNQTPSENGGGALINDLDLNDNMTSSNLFRNIACPTAGGSASSMSYGAGGHFW